MENNFIIRSLKERINNHSFFKHPFLKLMSSKSISFNEARRFALLYYPHILRTRLYQANTLGITPDEKIQSVFADILYDEYGNGDEKNSHMEVYRKLLRSLNYTQNEIENAPIIPEQQEYINTMMEITQGKNWLMAVGASGIAGEWPIPPYYKVILQGLRTVPELTDNDLELFISHVDLDIEHSLMIENALIPYISSPEGYASLWKGIQINLDARLTQLDGLQREVFGKK